MFDDFLAGRDDPQPPFTADDYLRFVDGKPRFDGVRSFVASRGIELPEGGLDDPPGVGSICALGNRKNALFTEIIESDGIDPFPGAVAVLDLLERLGVEMAVVSSSRNAAGGARRLRSGAAVRGRDRRRRRRRTRPARQAGT